MYKGTISHPATRATRSSVRLLIPPTSCPCSLAPSATAPPYDTTVSQTLRRLCQLLLCLERLPPPSLPLLAYMPQVGEGREMVGEDQSVLLCCKIEDATLAGRSLLGNHVEDGGPPRIFQMEWVEHCVGDV